MQAAHSTRNPVASLHLAVVELPLLPLVRVAVVGVLVVAMFATDRDFEPPHPASTIAAAAARIASAPDRRQIVALAGLPAFFERSALPFIGSPIEAVLRAVLPNGR